MKMEVFMITKSKKWQLQEAKNRFSEVVRKASEEGPQTVTKHGKDSVVVLSAEDYRKLEQPKSSLIEFFQKSPLAKVEMDLKRDKSPSRQVDL
jgi:prevent-host-death family protein